jgi:hypothetical protein
VLSNLLFLGIYEKNPANLVYFHEQPSILTDRQTDFAGYFYDGRQDSGAYPTSQSKVFLLVINAGTYSFELWNSAL